MAIIPRLAARDASTKLPAVTPPMTNLLIALLSLIIFGICLAACLLILRSRRRKAKQAQTLSDMPFHQNQIGSRTSNHRRLTVTTSPYGRHSVPQHAYKEKEMLVDSAPHTPTSPVPEIRITFPEEEDEGGKRKSGRVVVVRISETGGLGLEPYHDDQLPPYQKSDDGKFQSLDLERMGGLKEMERRPRMK